MQVVVHALDVAKEAELRCLKARPTGFCSPPCSETKTRSQVVKARSLASAAVHFRCRQCILLRIEAGMSFLISQSILCSESRSRYEHDASVSDVEHPAGTNVPVLL